MSGYWVSKSLQEKISNVIRFLRRLTKEHDFRLANPDYTPDVAAERENGLHFLGCQVKDTLNKFVWVQNRQICCRLVTAKR